MGGAKPDVSWWVHEIASAGWWVRHYAGAHGSVNRMLRTAAIQRFGETCRAAFIACDDYEALLTAILNALLPGDPRF